MKISAQPDAASGPSALHAVVGDAPSAVLVVDLTDGTVVHANEVARQLAPQTQLPARLDDWAEDAGLRDSSGTELADTEHPLSRLLRSEAVPGRAVSALRRSEMGASREPLWAVGVPMAGAPMLDRHALVVLLSLREQAAHAPRAELAEDGVQLHEKAVFATGLSFTVADARDPELPLVWVNPAFTLATGYEFDEAVGRNCRFLQGPGTDREEVARLREALRNRTGTVATLLNYRKDGLAFWNQVTVTPIVDATGETTHFVGVQSDVTGRIESDRQRDRALLAAQSARVEAETAQARLSLLAEATASLTGALEEADARSRLLGLVVPALGDVGVFLHLHPDGTIEELEVLHGDLSVDTDDLAGLVEPGRGLAPTGDLVEALMESLLSGEPLLVPETRGGPVPGVTSPARVLRSGSILLIPLAGRDHVRDVLVLGRAPSTLPYSDDDAHLATDLGRRTGLILDNLRLYAGQSRIARTLQRSLLPSVPELELVEIDARYLPGAEDAEVGGDFYDVFDHDGESLGVAVGDVEGHDVVAAAAMGRLRGMLRATALSQRLMPAATLEHVDWLLAGDPRPAGGDSAPLDHSLTPRLASMVFMHLEPPVRPLLGDLVRPDDDDAVSAEVGAQQSGRWPRQAPPPDSHRHAPAAATPASWNAADSAWTLTLSTAGHLPPLVRLPEGRLIFLDPPHARGPLLGLGETTRRRHDATFALPVGSVLLLYTDGLVERSREGIDDGLGRLLEVASKAPEGLEEFVDHLIDNLAPGNRSRGLAGPDDIVVVALRLGDHPDQTRTE